MVENTLLIPKKHLKSIRILQKICSLSMRSMGIRTRICSHTQKMEHIKSRTHDLFECAQTEFIWKIINNMAKHTMPEYEQKIFKILAMNQSQTILERIPHGILIRVIEHTINIIKTLKKEKILM